MNPLKRSRLRWKLRRGGDLLRDLIYVLEDIRDWQYSLADRVGELDRAAEERLRKLETSRERNP